MQSSNHGPEFLEQRINNFLVELGKDPNGPFTKEQVEKIKLSQQQSLSQKPQDIATETQENWIYMQGDYIDPKSLSVQNVTGMLQDSFSQVTAKKVNQCFRDLFLGNQKRVNIKLVSQNHLGDSEIKKENQKQYKGMNLDYKEVTDLKSLYSSLPKMTNLIQQKEQTRNQFQKERKLK